MNEAYNDRLVDRVKSFGAVNARRGELVKGIVTDIMDYGVFIQNPELNLNGLLHKSKVGRDANGKERGYFLDANDLKRHFKVGDYVTVRVTLVKPDNKVELTTSGLELPVYAEIFATPAIGITRMSDRLGAIRGEIQTTPAPVVKTELDDIMELLRSKIGAISSTSKVRLAELLGKHGTVRLAVATMKSVDEFKPVDQSMMIVELVEKHVGTRLPKYTFHLSDHARLRWTERGDGGDLQTRLKESSLLFEDEMRKRRVYGDGIYVYPCVILENGENRVKTVTLIEEGVNSNEA